MTEFISALEWTKFLSTKPPSTNKIHHKTAHTQLYKRINEFLLRVIKHVHIRFGQLAATCLQIAKQAQRVDYIKYHGQQGCFFTNTKSEFVIQSRFTVIENNQWHKSKFFVFDRAFVPLIEAMILLGNLETCLLQSLNSPTGITLLQHQRENINHCIQFVCLCIHMKQL